VGAEINTAVEGNLAILHRLQARTVPFATINCGWEFAMTASGRLDGRIMKNPWGGIWDYAPGSLLVSEAGGQVANLGCHAYDYRNFDCMAVTPRVFRELTGGEDAIFPIEE
jgi:fructose-1,6-bisphosphatase/inositol monophosphatase family enzyme